MYVYHSCAMNVLTGTKLSLELKAHTAHCTRKARGTKNSREEQLLYQETLVC